MRSGEGGGRGGRTVTECVSVSGCLCLVPVRY